MVRISRVTYDAIPALAGGMTRTAWINTVLVAVLEQAQAESEPMALVA